MKAVQVFRKGRLIGTLEALGEDSPDELPTYYWQPVNDRRLRVPWPGTLFRGLSDARAMLGRRCRREDIVLGF